MHDFLIKFSNIFCANAPPTLAPPIPSFSIRHWAYLHENSIM